MLPNPISIVDLNVSREAAFKARETILGSPKGSNLLKMQTIADTYTALVIEQGQTDGFTKLDENFLGSGTNRRSYLSSGRVEVGILDPVQGAPVTQAGRYLIELTLPAVLANSFTVSYESQLQFSGSDLDSFAEDVRTQVEAHVIMRDKVRLLETTRGARKAAIQVEIDANGDAVYPPVSAVNGFGRYDILDGISDNTTATGARAGWSLLSQQVTQDDRGGTAIILGAGLARDPAEWSRAFGNIIPTLQHRKYNLMRGTKAAAFIRPVVHTVLKNTQYATTIKFENQSAMTSTGLMLQVDQFNAMTTAYLPDPNDIGKTHVLSKASNANQYNTTLDDARVMAVIMVKDAVVEGRWHDIFTTANVKDPLRLFEVTMTLSSIGVVARKLPYCIGIFSHADDGVDADALNALYLP